jgi:putative SOS response-associated peptidase YedK
VIRLCDDKRYVDQLRWGLLPVWAKDEKFGYKCINARAETVAEKPAFRNAFKKRRCLVIADAHYEWTIDGKKRIPWMFRIGDDESYAMAGLWEEWKNPAGETITTTAIITTEPNELCNIVHDRMPVILDASEYDTWLNPETPADQLTPLLDSYPADTMV